MISPRPGANDRSSAPDREHAVRASNRNDRSASRVFMTRSIGSRDPELYSALQADRALRLRVEGVDRLSRGHEEPVAQDAAEAEVGARLGQENARKLVAVWREHVDAVEAFAALGGGPHVAVH